MVDIQEVVVVFVVAKEAVPFVIEVVLFRLAVEKSGEVLHEEDAVELISVDKDGVHFQKDEIIGNLKEVKREDLIFCQTQ